MIVAPIITQLGQHEARIDWTGDAGATVRVFLNGALAFGPEAIATAAKSVRLSLPDPCTVEVHENPAGEDVPGAALPLERRPLLWWSSVDGAVAYRIRLGDRVLASVLHEPSLRHHEHQLLQDIRQQGPAWVTLTIEAVLASGVAGTAASIDYFAPGLPAGPADLVVSGSGGVFDLEVST